MSLLPRVSGATDVYLIQGDSLEQNLVMELFNPIFVAAGMDALLVPLPPVERQNLGAFVRTAMAANNIRGLWVAP
jgi:shikimate dehydrogenase